MVLGLDASKTRKLTLVPICFDLNGSEKNRKSKVSVPSIKESSTSESEKVNLPYLANIPLPNKLLELKSFFEMLFPEICQ